MTDKIKRAKGGRFAKGQSGNPKGGSRSAVAKLADQIIGKDGEAIAAKCVAMALAGDQNAMRLCMERVCPPRKGRLVEFDLPAMEGAKDHPAAIGAVLRAVSVGELTPDEALVFANIVGEHRKAVEVADLAERIAALEATNAPR